MFSIENWLFNFLNFFMIQAYFKDGFEFGTILEKASNCTRQKNKKQFEIDSLWLSYKEIWSLSFSS